MGGAARRQLIVAAMVVAWLAMIPAQLRAQAPITEDEGARLVMVLGAEAPAAEKVRARKRLAVIGTRDAVGPLAGLLTDAELSHAARIALEAIPDASAGEALRAALGKVQGKLLVGVINSLGARREASAAAELAQHLGDADVAAVRAAAAALGRIGTAEALGMLEQALGGATAELRAAAADGCLHAAEALAKGGKREEATAAYARVRQADVPEHVRLAAVRGEILSRDAGAVELMVEQLIAPSDAQAAVALGAARELAGDEVTGALVATLPGLAPARQALVLAVLGDRGDRAALPAVLHAATKGESAARVAAIRALATLGDGSAVGLLMETAGNADEPLATAARETLGVLDQPAVDETVTARLAATDGTPPVWLVELAGWRRLAAATPALLKAADDADESLRLAAIRALGQTAAAAELATLVRRVVAPASGAEGAAARSALEAATARLSDKEACGRELAAALTDAPMEAKRTLVELLGMAGGPTALRAAAAAALDPNAELQDTATRVLGEWPTPDVAPVLAEVAERSPNGKLRVRTLRGYIRVIRQMDVADAEKIAMCQRALGLAERNEERALAIEALGRVASAEALQAVLPHLAEAPLKDAACAAALTIGEAIVAKEPAATAAAMERVLAAGTSGEIARRAGDVLAQAKGAVR